MGLRPHKPLDVTPAAADTDPWDPSWWSSLSDLRPNKEFISSFEHQRGTRFC